MKKVLFILPVLALLIAGCGTESGTTGTSADDAIDMAEDSIKADTIPDNLIQCDPKFFERGADGIAPDCDTFGGDAVCAFHTKDKNGESKIENIQYDNACAACRFYSDTNVREMGSTTYTLHGYLESGCEGTIWE